VTVRTFEVLIIQAEENAKVQEEALNIAQSRFKNGATSELDPDQAATLLESTRATIPQLQIGLEQARNALCTLLGQPTGSVEALLKGAKGMPAAPAQVAVGMPAELLRRRPDVRSAELVAAAQCSRVGVAEAELYPSFSLLGSVGLDATTAAHPTTLNLFSLSSIFYSVGPRVSWPFFNYGRIRNNVRAEDARFQETLISYRDTVLRAAQEVDDALAGYLDAQNALVFETNSVQAAQKSVQIAIVQYREGATDYQRVLDAQRSLLQQQTSQTQTASSVLTYLISLYKALGGGWEVRQDAPAVPEAMQAEMKARTNWGDMLGEPRTPETTNRPTPAKQ
jgi:NodT family efflux transporter outer membrane factor (OMF) lipoprotein